MIDKKKRKIKRVKTADISAVLTLFFCSILFFYDLFAEKFLLTERDLGAYFIPPRFFWVESLTNGNFPLWNPFQFTGHPFFANPQYGILYPLNWLFFLLPFDMAFNAVIILHFFLGGLFTYLLLKDLRVNTTGSLISGLIFMLSGYLLSVHSLLTTLLSCVWTPLIMMFFRRAINGQGFKNEMVTALLITLSFLGGGVEIVYGNFFVLLIMVLFSSLPYANVGGQKFFNLDRHSGLDPESSISKLDSRFRGNDGIGTEFVGDKPRRYKFVLSVPIYWGRIRSLLIVSILFLFLSAIQLFPFIELFHHSIRGNGISYQEATTWSFAPKDILLFFLPDAYGYFLDVKRYWTTQCWLKTLYTGGLPFILSVIFFLLPRPPKDVGEPSARLPDDSATEGCPYKMCYSGSDRKLYLALMVFSLFLSLGHYNPLYPFVFRYVPIFNGIRYPVKFLYIFVLVVSIIAGLGLQTLMGASKNGDHRKLKRILIVFSLTSGLLLLCLVLGNKEVEHFAKLKGIDFPEFNHLPVNLHHAKRFLFYLTLFFLLLRVGYEVKWKGWAKVLLVLFLVTDLFGNMGFYGKEKTSDYFRKTRILEMISQDHGHFRVFSTSKTISLDTPILAANASPADIFKEKHLPSMNLPYRLNNIWGIDVIRVKRVDDLYRAFTGASSISATHLIDLYGVKYVISVTPLQQDPRFELIYARLEGLEGKREDLLKENTVKLYKNRRPVLRGWLVKDFKVMDSEGMLLRMISDDFKPGREVLLEEEPKWVNASSVHFTAPTPPFVKGGERGITKKGLAGNVEFTSERNNRLQLVVKTTKDSVLVLNDTYYPGWKAFVDGKETKIYRADYTFRAVLLSAGKHKVEFVYDPLSFRLGAGVTLFGIIGCIVIGLSTRRRRP